MLRLQRNHARWLWLAVGLVLVAGRPVPAVEPEASDRARDVPVTLEQLERAALAHNPTLVQAATLVEAARGRTIQAGLYPNPTIGYTGSEIGNDGRGGQQGIAVGQEIVTGGKLRLSRAVAAYERAQAEHQSAAQVLRVLNAVRTLFYETLAAEQTTSVTDELVRLDEDAARIAQQREKAGEGTLTEVLQAQIELEQAKILATNSRNNHRAAWQRLGAVIGRPDAEPAPLAGSLEGDREKREWTAALDRVLAQSPEVQIAQAGVRRAEAVLERARVQPVPNISLEASTQYDFGSRTQIAGVGIGIPLPIFNRNQGNVLAAESELLRARKEVERVKFALVDRFAAPFARYRNASEQVERYGTRLSDEEVRKTLTLRGEERQRQLDAFPQILPRAQLALALASEGWQRGQFDYLPVLTAQRTLAQTSLAYIRALADLRQSLVAIDGLLLTDGLSAPGGSGSAESGRSAGGTE